MRKGYRIHIAEDDTGDLDCPHYSGVGDISDAVELPCPNCSTRLFPAISLSFSDPRLGEIIPWREAHLHVLFCPACAFYMRPYWIRHRAGLEVVGGYRDGGEILQRIELPYKAREIALLPLRADDYASDADKEARLLERRHPPGVYHQIGGEPIRGQTDNVECCDCGKQMSFAGILDYDDLNIPLYEEGHSPVSLIIGDSDSMNIYSCVDCSVLGLKWAK